MHTYSKLTAKLINICTMSHLQDEIIDGADIATPLTSSSNSVFIGTKHELTLYESV